MEEGACLLAPYGVLQPIPRTSFQGWALRNLLEVEGVGMVVPTGPTLPDLKGGSVVGCGPSIVGTQRDTGHLGMGKRYSRDPKPKC